MAGEVKEDEGESKAANLPGKSFEAIIVPRADIKTKPRACNFALKRALGEFCVIMELDPPEVPMAKGLCPNIFGLHALSPEIIEGNWDQTLFAFSFLFLYPISILCLFNLVVGNSIYIIIHLYAAIKTRKYFLVPYALSIPLYWVLISIGCWKGTIQLITRPFYWEKTTHALYKAK